MNCKRILFFGLLLATGLAAKAQDLIRADFKIADYTTGIRYAELTFKQFIIGIGRNGSIVFIEDPDAGDKHRSDDFEDNLINNQRQIGDLTVTYYDNFDRYKTGKVKSIGNVSFNYYDNFDIHDKPGMLKSIGNMEIKYNNVFDIHDKRGTVKSIGKVQITWHNAFDSSSIRGKIKSIVGNTRELQVTKEYQEPGGNY